MQYPRIHLNGSSAESLLADYRTAHVAVEKAIGALQEIDVNGRDYYTIDNNAYLIARNEHRERIAVLNKVRDELAAIWRNIDVQHDERNKSRAR